VSTRTSTSLSAHEVDEIVAEAAAWLDSGAPLGLSDKVALGLSTLAEGYAEGVIAERVRGRELRNLARRLAQALEAHRDYVAATRAKRMTLDVVEALAKSDVLLDDARKAGLLESAK